MSTRITSFFQFWTANFTGDRAKQHATQRTRMGVGSRRRPAARVVRMPAACNEPAVDQPADALPARRRPVGLLQLHSYQTLAEARKVLSDLPSPATSTVVLVLPRRADANLAELIRRDGRAWQLILVPLDDTAGVSLGDLALHSARLGWHSICREFVVNTAIQTAMEAAAPQEPVVILWPATQELKYIPGFAKELHAGR